MSDRGIQTENISLQFVCSNVNDRFRVIKFDEKRRKGAEGLLRLSPGVFTVILKWLNRNNIKSILKARDWPELNNKTPAIISPVKRKNVIMRKNGQEYLSNSPSRVSSHEGFSLSHGPEIQIYIIEATASYVCVFESGCRETNWTQRIFCSFLITAKLLLHPSNDILRWTVQYNLRLLRVLSLSEKCSIFFFYSLIFEFQNSCQR